ncbi:MAG: hypothetical protein SGPRY_012627, partial [Prymnesium sp.]
MFGFWQRNSAISAFSAYWLTTAPLALALRTWLNSKDRRQAIAAKCLSTRRRLLRMRLSKAWMSIRVFNASKQRVRHLRATSLAYRSHRQLSASWKKWAKHLAFRSVADALSGVNLLLDKSVIEHRLMNSWVRWNRHADREQATAASAVRSVDHRLHKSLSIAFDVWSAKLQELDRQLQAMAHSLSLITSLQQQMLSRWRQQTSLVGYLCCAMRRLRTSRALHMWAATVAARTGKLEVMRSVTSCLESRQVSKAWAQWVGGRLVLSSTQKRLQLCLPHVIHRKLSRCYRLWTSRFQSLSRLTGALRYSTQRKT